MNSKTMTRTIPTLLFVLGIVGVSGCTAMPEIRFPNNNMCPPTHSCSASNCPHDCASATTVSHAELQPEPDVAFASAAESADQLSDIRQQIEALESGHATVQEQLSLLDTSMEEQRLDRQSIVSLLEDVTTALSEVRQEIGEQKANASDVASRISQQRQQNEELLTEVERKLSDISHAMSR